MLRSGEKITGWLNFCGISVRSIYTCVVPASIVFCQWSVYVHIHTNLLICVHRCQAWWHLFCLNGKGEINTSVMESSGQLIVDILRSGSSSAVESSGNGVECLDLCDLWWILLMTFENLRIWTFFLQRPSTVCSLGYADAMTIVRMKR